MGRGYGYMNLGAFSISLSVRDLAASRDFYAALGFEPFAGKAEENWLILRNGNHVIGLFQGMFEGNILTFNPGWDQSGAPVDPFTDIRDIQRSLRQQGVALSAAADETGTGPASIMLTDPDGNAILIDQHR
jgi:lactoylglutathione lyase